MSEMLDSSNIYDEREETIEGYTTGSGDKTVLHYPKKAWTRQAVIKNAFEGKDKLDRRWWKIVSTEDEYQLVMHPRLLEGSKLTSKKPLTYSEQRRFGVYETERSTKNRRIALSMDAMVLGSNPNPSFETAHVDTGFGNARKHSKDFHDQVKSFYGF